MSLTVNPRLLADGLAVSLADQERSFTLRVDDFALLPRQVVALTGASGSGKTLLLETLGLLKRPSAVGVYRVETEQRAITLGGKWISRRQAASLRGQVLGFVPQSGGLLPFLNVLENVLLTQEVAQRRDRVYALSLLEQLHLGGLEKHWPHQLSIGQRQRVSIARAIAHRPAIVIADEPTAALDPANAENAMRLLVETVIAAGSSLLFSSHDTELVGALGIDRYHLNVQLDDSGSSVESRLSVWKEASNW